MTGISDTKRPMCGGLSDLQKPSEMVKDLFHRSDGGKVKLLQHPKATGLDKSHDIEILGARTQVVAGLNVYLKCKVKQTGECFHAVMFRNLDDKVEITGLARNKKAEDPVESSDFH